MVIKEGYKQTDIGLIPNDWQVKKINEFTQVASGGTPSTSRSDYWGGDIRWMNSGELNLKIVNEVENRITELGLKNSATKFIPINCILIGLAGQGKTRGTVAINKIKLCTNQSIAAIFPSNEVYDNFLYFNLDGRYNELRMLSTGDGGRGGLNLTIIKNLDIALPTLSEQTAIATALSDADGLITGLEKLIAKKRNIKQGTMQQLLQPKEGWEVKKLGEIAEVRDGTHQTPKYVKSGIPFYSVESVTNNNFTNTKFISIEEHIFLTKTFRMEKGDVLMTRIGSIGDCKLIDWDVDASFYVSLALLKMKKDFSAEYVCHYSKTSHFKKEIELNSLQYAIPKKINLGPISNIKIELPSFTEQTRIATILSDMDEELSALEQKLEKYKKIKLGMMQELLTGKTRLV